MNLSNKQTCRLIAVKNILDKWFYLFIGILCFVVLYQVLATMIYPPVSAFMTHAHLQVPALILCVFVLGWVLIGIFSRLAIKGTPLRKFFLILPDQDLSFLWLYPLVGAVLCIWTHWTVCACLLIMATLLSLATVPKFPARSQKSTSQTETKAKSSGSKNLLKDAPIVSAQDESLGRTDFINTLLKIIRNCKGKENRLLLDGAWGCGKTSIINCIKQQLQKHRRIEYCEVNPWSNDTKEKFATALLGEIDHFCKNTYPAFSISNSLSKNVLATVESLHVGPLQFHLPQMEDNISNNIAEFSKKLSYKTQKLLIVIDDLDRLTRPQILDILGIVYLFSQCHNLIFLLVANKDKVESILTQEKDACTPSKQKIKSMHCYTNYIDKMASCVIHIPDIEPRYLDNFLLLQIDNILKRQQLPPLCAKEKNIFPKSCFQDLRAIKRTLACFSNSLMQPSVCGEVNPFHLLLVTLLYIQFPDVYHSIRPHAQSWLKKSTSLTQTDTDYFNDLLKAHPLQTTTLEHIFTVLTPNFAHAQSQQGVPVLLAQELPANPTKPFFSKRYFKKYFTQNFNIGDIPDYALDNLLKQLNATKPQNRLRILVDFLKKFHRQVTALIEYMEINYIPESFKTLLLQAWPELVNHSLKEDEAVPFTQKIAQFSLRNTLHRNDIYDASVHVKSLFLNYVFYREYYKKHTRIIDGRFRQKLQQDTTPVKHLLLAYKNYPQEAETYRQFILAWARNFTKSAYAEPARKTRIIPLFKQNEELFWNITGASIFSNITDRRPMTHEIKFWGYDSILKITAALLSTNNPKHRQELTTIQEFCQKRTLNHTTA